MLVIWNYSVRRSCSFFPVIYSIMYLCECGFEAVYFILQVIIKYYSCLFHCSKCFYFRHWELFHLVPLLFTYTFIFCLSLFPYSTPFHRPSLSSSLLSGTTKGRDKNLVSRLSHCFHIHSLPLIHVICFKTPPPANA